MTYTTIVSRLQKNLILWYCVKGSMSVWLPRIIPIVMKGAPTPLLFHHPQKAPGWAGMQPINNLTGICAGHTIAGHVILCRTRGLVPGRRGTRISCILVEVLSGLKD